MTDTSSVPTPDLNPLDQASFAVLVDQRPDYVLGALTDAVLASSDEEALAALRAARHVLARRAATISGAPHG